MITRRGLLGHMAGFTFLGALSPLLGLADKPSLQERMLRGETIEGESFVINEPLYVPNTPFIMRNCCVKVGGDAYFWIDGGFTKPRIENNLFLPMGGVVR